MSIMIMLLSLGVVLFGAVVLVLAARIAENRDLAASPKTTDKKPRSAVVLHHLPVPEQREIDITVPDRTSV